MSNLARKMEWYEAPPAVRQDAGRVVAADGVVFTVRIGGSEIPASRATSCLVEPRVGDLVLLALLPGGECYVLAILDREAPGPARLVADGDMEINLREGKLTVAAQRGVDLVSAEAVSIASRAFDVNAVDGNVVLERLSMLGSFVAVEIDRAKLFAETVDSVVDRLSQRVKRSLRFVSELDQVRAESVDYAARKAMRLHGKNALVTAEELVKVDGEQIHMG